MKYLFLLLFPTLLLASGPLSLEETPIGEEATLATNVDCQISEPEVVDGGMCKEEYGYSRIFGGGQAYYYRLQITDSGGANATPNPFTGCLAGFVLGFEYKEPSSLYAVLQGSYAMGTITTSGTGNNSRYIHDGLLETRFGYNFSLMNCDTLLFTPYTGAAYRWNFQYRKPGTLPGLKLHYYKICIPVGMVLSYIPNEVVNIGVDFEWLPDVLSMVAINSLKGSYWQLRRMNNYIVQLPCIFTFAERWELSLTPFWMHFWDGASIAVSDAGVALGLDKQMTNNWGGRLSLGVQF